MKNKKIIFVISIVLFSMLILFSCFLFLKKQDKTPAIEKNIETKEEYTQFNNMVLNIKEKNDFKTYFPNSKEEIVSEFESGEKLTCLTTDFNLMNRDGELKYDDDGLLYFTCDTESYNVLYEVIDEETTKYNYEEDDVNKIIENYIKLTKDIMDVTENETVFSYITFFSVHGTQKDTIEINEFNEAELRNYLEILVKQFVNDEYREFLDDNILTSVHTQIIENGLITDVEINSTEMSSFVTDVVYNVQDN